MTKPKKVETAQQQMRKLRKEIVDLDIAYRDMMDQKHEYQRQLLEARQDLARAREVHDKLAIQVARKEGYIDRVREIEAYQKEYHAKEQEARLGIQPEPAIGVSQIDALREHLASCPEQEAKKILDVISEDLKNRVTGFDPNNPEPTDQGYSYRNGRWAAL